MRVCVRAQCLPISARGETSFNFLARKLPCTRGFTACWPAVRRWGRVAAAENGVRGRLKNPREFEHLARGEWGAGRDTKDKRPTDTKIEKFYDPVQRNLDSLLRVFRARGTARSTKIRKKTRGRRTLKAQKPKRSRVRTTARTVCDSPTVYLR